MNSSGKVLMIFLVIIAILLISLTAISLFFFQKEIEHRKLVEATLGEYRIEKTGLEEELKKVKKKNFLLQEKNKEADERVNDLSDELELEKGLREEMKIEAAALKEKMEEALASKEALAGEIKVKMELQDKLTADLVASEQKIKELENQLEVSVGYREETDQLDEQQQQGKAPQLEEVSDEVISGEVSDASDEEITGEVLNSGVELEEIVVIPADAVPEEESAVATETPSEEAIVILNEVLEGRILSVDTETEFVIVNIGKKDGVTIGNVLSVYRGKDHMGDIKITRLQPEMSAADLIPPFSIRNVQKNDQVKTK